MANECNQCGAPISWNKTIREKFGIKGPLEPDDSGKHTCDDERKKAYKSNAEAEALATIDAREKAAAMGGENNNNPKLDLVEIYLKGHLEEIRRAVDLLGKIAMNVESMDFRLKKIEQNQINRTPPPRPDLGTKDEEVESQPYGQVLDKDKEELA